MQTTLAQPFQSSKEGQRAEEILRSCVHCGFCTATCPTYLLTGNELDSPRGRIYLVKQLLEDSPDSAGKTTLQHLDRCLGCQSCETTCPSDVQYLELLDIGKAQLLQKTSRPLLSRLRRHLLLYCISTPIIFRSLIRLASILKVVLPKSLSRQLPAAGQFNLTIKRPSQRKVVLLNGCVQNTLSPATNNAARAVLSHLNISVQEIEQESCCGALHYHSDYAEKGKRNAKKLLAQLEAALDEGAEAVVSTASGCGTFLKHYPSLFQNDTSALELVKKINHRVMDIGEFIARADSDQLELRGSTRLAFHSPCTLQHGQGLNEVTESLLTKMGIQLEQTKDRHLCCGSAGTYSLFQPAMSKALKKQKLEALGAESVDKIATANIGCQCHLASGTDKSVRHWIEYVAELLPK